MVTFHTPKTFLKFGWKQWATWVGVILIIWCVYEFRHDFSALISNILRSPDLAKEIVSSIGMILGGLGGSYMIIVNKFRGKKDD